MLIAGDLPEKNKFDLPIIAYEGGQGLDGSTNQAAKVAAQSDVRIFTAYRQYYAIWDKLIGMPAQ